MQAPALTLMSTEVGPVGAATVGDPGSDRAEPVRGDEAPRDAVPQCPFDVGGEATGRGGQLSREARAAGV